jgi:AbrB family looped-hinge helix DNA binding protein
METTISSKFQVVIPKDVRRKLGLRPKQKLLVMEKAGILYMIPQQPLEELQGFAESVAVEGYREKGERF